MLKRQEKRLRKTIDKNKRMIDENNIMISECLDDMDKMLQEIILQLDNCNLTKSDRTTIMEAKSRYGNVKHELLMAIPNSLSEECYVYN